MSFVSGSLWLLPCWQQCLYSAGQEAAVFTFLCGTFTWVKDHYTVLPEHFIIYASAENKHDSKRLVTLLSICWIYVPFYILLIHKKAIHCQFYKRQPHVSSFHPAVWKREGCWRWDGSEKGSCFASQILRWFLKSAFRKSIVLQYMQW